MCLFCNDIFIDLYRTHVKYVLSRIERAREQHIPMTNYGVAIAFLNGILDQIKC